MSGLNAAMDLQRADVPRPRSAEEWTRIGEGFLPGLVGLEFLEVTAGHVRSRLPLRRDHMAPNTFLHAAVVIALADTSCGYGATASLPDGADNFTTIELKSNFLGTARQGAIACEATMLHGGRSTQLWDATVTDESTGKTIAAFRCTQLVLYPKG